MNTDDPIFVAIREEFAGSDGADIDERSLIAHAKATVVLAAANRPATAENYAAALAAVEDPAGRWTATDDVVTQKCETAAALSDLAENNLYRRGVRRSDRDYEALYLAEISAVSAEFNLPYHQLGA